jgi:hypothetical protein
MLHFKVIIALIFPLIALASPLAWDGAPAYVPTLLDVLPSFTWGMGIEAHIITRLALLAKLFGLEW